MEIQCKRLMNIGVDVDTAVRRLGGNELLYLSICSKFLNDINFQLIQEALSVQNYEASILLTHTLKGVAANLGFVQLENNCKALLQALKDNELKNISMNQTNLTMEYHRIITVLNDFSLINKIEYKSQLDNPFNLLLFIKNLIHKTT